MNPIVNAAPMSRLQGIDDQSGRAVDNEPAVRPTHLPHVFIYAERGSLDPELLIGNGLNKMYGARSFDFRAPFANHQTKILTTAVGNANAVMAQRIVPADIGPKAGMTLWFELLNTDLPVYVRGADNGVLRQNGYPLYVNDADPADDTIYLIEDPDAAGSYIVAANFFAEPSTKVVGTPSVVDGYQGVWTVEPMLQYNAGGEVIQGAVEDTVPVSNAVGQASTASGGGVLADPNKGTVGTVGTRYPIMDLEVAWLGSYGSRVGLRMSASTMKSAQPPKEVVYLDERTVTGRLQLVERPVNASTPIVTKTLTGDQSIEFSFKEGALDPTVEQDLYLGDQVIDSYNEETYGAPFGDVHIYQDNIDTILGTIVVNEATYHPEIDAIVQAESAADAMYMMNFIDGLDFEGNEYNTFEVVGSLETGGVGVSMGSTVNHYAIGGDDGTMSFTDHANRVGVICENYEDGEWDFMDDALYPQSVIYDSGFPLEVKKKLFVPMGARKDIVTIVGTQDISQPQNSIADDSSTAIALRTAARLYPESEVYGTSVCRAMIMAHSGKLINDPYKGILPLTIEACQKFSKYMGAGDRNWKSNFKFDDPANNKLELFDPRTVIGAYVPAPQRAKDWDTGMIRVQNYNRSSLYVPAWQTVYDDDTSVLNAAANVWVAVEIEKICQEVWRELTGIGYLTESQFIERSNRLIAARTKEAAFDNRVIIEAETYKTPADNQRGYSWSTNVTMYANNMQTVGTYTVTARRMSDLAA